MYAVIVRWNTKLNRLDCPHRRVSEKPPTAFYRMLTRLGLKSENGVVYCEKDYFAYEIRLRALKLGATYAEVFRKLS